VESSPTMGGLASHCHERLNYTKKKKDENVWRNERKMSVEVFNGSQWLSFSSSSSSRFFMLCSPSEVPFSLFFLI